MKQLTFFDDSTQVYVIESDDFIKPNSIDLGDYISVLSREEKDRFDRYKNENAKFTFLTARYFLRVLLAKKLKENGEASNLIIETTTSGKPYLKDYPSLFFNISHTEKLILIGFANSPIGVDVEKIDRTAEKESIIKRFFSIEEQQSYYTQTEEKENNTFFIGWTRKEAVLKANGEGLSSMEKIEVSFERNALSPIIRNKTKYSYKVKDFIPADGYTACIVLIEK